MKVFFHAARRIGKQFDVLDNEGRLFENLSRGDAESALLLTGLTLRGAQLVTTQAKLGASPDASNDNRVVEFIRQHCHAAQGHSIPFSDFFQRFQQWLPAEERAQWSRLRTSRTLPEAHPSGGRTANVAHVGNLSWFPADDLPYVLVLKNHALRKFFPKRQNA